MTKWYGCTAQQKAMEEKRSAPILKLVIIVSMSFVSMFLVVWW